MAKVLGFFGERNPEVSNEKKRSPWVIQGFVGDEKTAQLYGDYET